MVIFLKVISLYGVTPFSMLAESREIKLKIQNQVKKGIELGIVKPFERYVLTGPCTGNQAIKALKYKLLSFTLIFIVVLFNLFVLTYNL